MIITKYTDYLMSSADFIIDFIKTELESRDVEGMTAGRTKAISVSGEHPLVRLTGSLIADGKPNFSGLLPAISVVEGDEREELTTMGQGQRSGYVINQQFLDDVRGISDMKDRVLEGIITDKQIDQIETAMNNREDKRLFMLTEAFKNRESMIVSVWGHSIQERRIVGSVLRSILFDMRKSLIARNVRDIVINTQKGLVNFDFGKIVHGQETEMSFLNQFTNYTVTDEIPATWDGDIQVYVGGEYISFDHVEPVKIHDIGGNNG